MNILEKNLVNQVVEVKINRNSYINLEDKPYTFILLDTQLLIGDTTTNKTIATIFSEKDDTNSFKALDTNTLIINPTDDLNKLFFNGDEPSSKELRRLIKNYFLESGSNLHIVQNKDDIKLNETVNYTVGITFLKKSDYSDGEHVIDKFMLTNDVSVFWLINQQPDYDYVTKQVFYLHTKHKDYLAHPAAYLNQLNLKEPAKDYCYSTINSFVPEIVEVEKDNQDQWKTNYVTLIHNKGMVIGGELIDGKNLVNEYMLQLFKKRVQYVIFNIITNKPNKSQINALLYNALITELNNLYNIGVIESGIYTGANVEIAYNGKKYIAAKNNDILKQGYILHIIDILQQSQQDKDKHMMTPITILLMFQSQIRFVTVNMEIL